MVLAHHAIFTAYGFWLPNDPRGSWSTEVWAQHLRPFGNATKTQERRSLAHDAHDRELRLAAKRAMNYPAVKFEGAQAVAVGNGFDQILAILQARVLACAIQPDHIHMVILRHRETIEQVVGFLKRAATRELNKRSIHPLAAFRNKRGAVPTPWADGGWHRFLNSEADILEAIGYVEENPVKSGRRAQRWSFVERFVPRGGTSRGRDG